tara:strand:+ start:107 stop:511 length:405 start_codon:yes stop_codon:yes gene_type:complete
MNNFKNNHRRSRFKSNNDRNFRKRNGNGHKVNGDFNNNLDFKRRNPGRNNQNASKLIDKYNDLAREALSNGDKILSESYLQHADHFSRIINSQEISKETNLNSSKSEQSIKEADKETDKKVDQNEKPADLNVND